MESTSVANITQVKALQIQRQTVHYVPYFYQILAQGLEVLQIVNSKLKTIEGDNFRQFPNLRYLDLSWNKITWLETNLFVNTPLLEYIDLSLNDLKLVGPNILQPLKSIQNMEFEDSGCLNSYASNPKEFGRLKWELLTYCGGMDAIVNTMSKNEKLSKELSDVKQQLNSCNNNLTDATRSRQTD